MKQTKIYPDFLQKRVEHYYDVRLKALEGGSLFHGPLASNDAIFLDNNDYLCLSDHPEIIEAQREQLKISEKSLMSNVFVYEAGLRDQFEQELAAFTKQENTILSTSGLDANMGLIQTITDRHTHIYMDKMVHASLYMGAQLTGAIVHRFRHNDVNNLEDLIQKFGVGIVVVDSVYSSFGSICPLTEVAEIAIKYGCILVVDESHSLGLYGTHGAGMVEELGLEEQVDFITASLSKTFCSRGGIITCSNKFREFFRPVALPAIFSSIVLNHEAARFIKTLEVIKREDAKRERLLQNATYLHKYLDNIGFNTEFSKSQIIPLDVRNETFVIKLRDLLIERGVVVAPFMSPAVPKNRCCGRMTVNCDLTLEQMDYVIKSCKEVLPLVVEGK